MSALIIYIFQGKHLLRFNIHRRKWTLVFPLIICALLSGYTFFSFFYVFEENLEKNQYVTVHGNLTKSFGNTPKQSKYNLINTQGCNIPFMDPFDETVVPLLSRVPKLNCNTNMATLTIKSLNSIQINKTTLSLHLYANFSHCKYFPIVKIQDDGPTGKRYAIMYEKAVYFQREVWVNDEFVKVECYDKRNNVIYRNYHAFIMENSKMNAWQSRTQRKTEALNVLILMVDSMSRNHFIRTLPKTRNFLLQELHAVELLGYNKVGDNTFPNLIPVLVGISEKKLRRLGWNSSVYFDDFDFIWKTFSKQNYTTFYAEDTPSYSTFNYLKRGFRRPPTNHFFTPMASAMQDEASLWSRKYCFADKLESKIMLDYLTDFVRVYKNKPFFALTIINRLSHDSMSDVSLLDDPLMQFLLYIHQRDILKNTILIVLSDHGQRFGEIRATRVGRLEERLPSFYMYLPEHTQQRNPDWNESLNLNAKRLTTPYDVHETLLDILRYSATSTIGVGTQGRSLFSNIPVTRTCKEANIPEHWCACNSFSELDVQGPYAKMAVDYIFEHINKRVLKPYLNICHQLHLKSIRSASMKKGPTFNLILVVIEAVPGNAIFEGTVVYNKETGVLKLSDGLSRLNLYRGQSDCIKNVSALRKHCFCKDRVY